MAGYYSATQQHNAAAPLADFSTAAYKDGRRAMAGQSVRVIDLSADAGAGLGIFENLHGANQSADFADALKEASV